MKTWVLLFFSAFTLGFCLSYLVTNSANQSPLVIHLNVTTDDRGNAETSVDAEVSSDLSKRHISFNRGETSSRAAGVLPKAHAGGRESLPARQATPMIATRGLAHRTGPIDPPAESPASRSTEKNRAGLAGKLLDAARHELDGRVDQRDLILASIFEEIIRIRISETAKLRVKTPAPRSRNGNLPVDRTSPPKNSLTRTPVEKEKVSAQNPAPEAVLNLSSPPDEPAPTLAPSVTAPGPLAVIAPGDEPPAAHKNDSPSGTAPGFRLVNVTFVKNLRGLRDFDPCPNIFSRGEKVQFKAEFEGLQEEPSGTEKDKTYRRRFSANWKLMDASSEIIDSRTFIKPRTIIYRPEERKNILMVFDTCELPNTLTPGNYRLLVQGKDLIAKKETASVLDLQVRKTSSLFSRKPVELDSSDIEIVPPYVEPEASPVDERNSTADRP